MELTGALTRPARDRQPTVTLVRIQGWMRHSKRCRPGASEPVVSVPPAGTPVAKRMPGVSHSGTGNQPRGRWGRASAYPPMIVPSSHRSAWLSLRWQLVAASLGAAGIHFAVIVPHFNEYRPYGVFFFAVAWFQAIWAVLVVSSEDRRVFLIGLIVNAIVVGIWVWSWTAGLPIGPDPGTAEEIGAADSTSTALEAVIVVWTTLLFAPIPMWREPSRRVVVGSAVVVWTVVIFLTVLAILAEAETASTGH